MTTRAVLLCCALLGISPVLAQTHSTESQDQWHYTGAVYLWGASLGGRTLNGSEAEVEFSQLIDSLEMGFMGAFEARKGMYSIFTDMIYLDFAASDTANLSIPVGPVQLPVKTATELDQTVKILTLGGGYEIYAAGHNRLDLIGGLRYFDIDMDLYMALESLGPGQSRTVSESPTSWNGIVGLKGRTSLSEHWYLPYNIDVGTGESKLTWHASAGIGFQAGNAWDLWLLYRHLELDLDSTRLIDKIDMSGPTMGVIYRW
ncbi:MAG: hypothetical protein JAY94_04650 [Candidatus Thiodiazotropha endolucinida]|nr:hypothetical protein [Candidatus Thiodiazotropha taylori]MCW4316778.1 hypothetical protein [Candidatus Thiodiazotropha taylori]